MPPGEVARLAARAGFAGVELRAHPEEPVSPRIDARQRADVRAEFARAGVEILAVAGYARVAEARDERGEEELAAELTDLVLLAAELEAPYVRVFPGGGDRPAAEADADAARHLAAVAPYAAERGVRVLLETHDSHPTGADATRVLGAVGHKNIGALWDVLHPWRAGEAPADTYAALAPYLGYVQVKDVASAQDTTPLPLGAGTLPLEECLAPLREAGWDGWLCWEYEKRWYPHATDLPALLAPGLAHLWQLLTTGGAGGTSRSAPCGRTDGTGGPGGADPFRTG
ncbi:sugar phosphate isomerase/epimerase family protein [Streptomyces sp. MST-110588]|uniref:sugar phosphate isomerase/epimerase family protein n=1 Tax=Streptomyces sp. MST-110588 TaxID=2833628 RepID=UPI001F5DA122|nr:sugar phosphate isomerase/epimerase family protein [Streptomyces sp. MST-110588]UNO41927.1 sugar phosphate isomerase/epimerase [Streptomyces sp. MST-110588]